MVAQKRKALILFGAVYDLTKFYNAHPGGKKVIDTNLGIDATEAFTDSGHLSKNYVLQMMAGLRVGKYLPNAKL